METNKVMEGKILDILEKHYHGRNHIESRCAGEILGLLTEEIYRLKEAVRVKDIEIARLKSDIPFNEEIKKAESCGESLVELRQKISRIFGIKLEDWDARNERSGIQGAITQAKACYVFVRVYETYGRISYVQIAKELGYASHQSVTRLRDVIYYQVPPVAKEIVESYAKQRVENRMKLINQEFV